MLCESARDVREIEKKCVRENGTGVKRPRERTSCLLVLERNGVYGEQKNGQGVWGTENG